MTSSTTRATQKGETILVAFTGEELIESKMVPILTLTQAEKQSSQLSYKLENLNIILS
ncbi:hypothetical protein AMTR_s02817p00007570, partial [Amborella trichopoda]